MKLRFQPLVLRKDIVQEPAETVEENARLNIENGFRNSDKLLLLAFSTKSCGLEQSRTGEGLMQRTWRRFKPCYEGCCIIIVVVLLLYCRCYMVVVLLFCYIVALLFFVVTLLLFYCCCIAVVMILLL